MGRKVRIESDDVLTIRTVPIFQPLLAHNGPTFSALQKKSGSKIKERGPRAEAHVSICHSPFGLRRRTDEEIARFCAEHGVTDSDLLIAQVLVPFETRPGETAKDAYERELRAMARNDDDGRKSQEALPDTA